MDKLGCQNLAAPKFAVPVYFNFKSVMYSVDLRVVWSETHSPCFSGVYSTIDAPFGARIPASTFAEHTPEVLLWAEGSDLLFDDTFPHFVVNDAREPRVVLPHPATHDKRALQTTEGGRKVRETLYGAKTV